MKKFGFTLAEVLVTLAIVGVVAALTIPSLNVNVSNQKLGPTLAKFVSEFENGVNLYMTMNDVPSFDLSQLSDARKQWTISPDPSDSNLWTLKSGGTMYALPFESADVPTGDTTVGTAVGMIEFDINGPTATPNKIGEDLFYFVVNSSGHLFPVGGATLRNDATKGGYSTIKGDFDMKCNSLGESTKIDCTKSNSGAKDAYAAGAIADNGWSTKGLAAYK